MTTVTTKHSHEVTDNDTDYQKYAEAINTIALRRYNQIFSGEMFEQIRLVRTEIDIFKEYLGGIPEDIRQQYNCNLCARFLNGIGSFATITNENKIEPLVFDLNDIDWVPENFVEAHNAILNVFSEENAGRLNIVTSNDVDELGDFLGKENAGGFKHLSLKHNTIEVIHDFKRVAFDTIAKSHGVGKDEIKLIHERLRSVADFDFSQLLAVDVIRENDKLVIEHIRNTSEIYKQSNPDIFVRRVLIDHGLKLLYLMKSVGGSIVTNLINGDTFEEAINKYKGYVDPRYYKRPIRLPSEKEFERSVAFLEDNGYADKLPVRFASDEEVYSLCSWVKPCAAEEAKAKGGMFDSLRKKIEENNGKTEAKKEKIVVPLEQISLNALIEIVKDYIDTNKLVGLELIARRLQIGSFITCQNENGFEIYKDKLNTRFFYIDPPINADEMSKYARPVTNEDNAVTGIIFGKDDYGRNMMNVVKSNHVWLIPMQSVVIPEDLIEPLQEHRRVIEHWAHNTPMNVGDNGEIVVYENILLNLGVAVGHGMKIETDDHILNFEITSVR